MDIVIDLGATNLRIVCIKNSSIIKRIDLKTKKGKELLINQLFDAIEEISNSVNSVTISICGPVDPKSSYVYALPNLDIVDFDLFNILKQRYDCPIKIINDANGAALSIAYNEAKEYSKVLFITISSGIGAGLVINKKIYPGAYGVALEIGKMFIDKTNLEAECSGMALLNKNGNYQNLKDYFEYIKENKDDINYQNWIINLAKSFCNVINVIDPDILVFDGGLFKSAEVFFEDLKNKIKENLFYNISKNLPIIVSKNEQNNALDGAILISQLDDYYL